MVNVDRMLAVSGIINLDPSKHNQRQWTCGTSFCYGGHAINLFLSEEHAWSPNGHLLLRPESNLLALGNMERWQWYGQPDGKIGSNITDDVWTEADTGAVAGHLLDIPRRHQVALFDAGITLEDVNRIALAVIDGRPYRHGEMCGCEYCYEDQYYGDDNDECPCGCQEYDSDAAYEDRNP